MNYNEERIENPDFLHLRLQGSWNREASRRSMRSIRRYLEDSGLQLLLLDDTGLESTGDVTLDYEEGRFMADQLQGLCRRVAVLVRPEDVDKNEFFEAVCQNRGLRLRIFSDPDAAEQWLLELRRG